VSLTSGYPTAVNKIAFAESGPTLTSNLQQHPIVSGKESIFVAAQEKRPVAPVKK
jgi:hypothetical protein